MYCVYCNKRINLKRTPDQPVWVASCDCASAEHAWLHIAEQKCITAAYRKSKESENGEEVTVHAEQPDKISTPQIVPTEPRTGSTIENGRVLLSKMWRKAKQSRRKVPKC